MYLILKLASKLPLWFLQTLACWAACILNSFNSSIKRITAINIQLAYPQLNNEERTQLIRASVRSQCMTYLEFVKCWGMPPQYSLNLFDKIEGETILTDALASQKGVIVVIPHFGCWELLNAWLNVHTQPMIMYKPNKIKGVNRYLLEARQQFNATLVPTDETGIRAIFKHLKSGGLTVILPDHLPKASGGIYAEFFQQSTLSATIVSKLANKTQCSVIGLSCVRSSDPSKFNVHCTALSEDILSKDLQLSVKALNHAMQDIINTAPEQYIWSYKRFRNRTGGVNPYRK
ncbi:MAG: lysophospholipid acyltransferase family protein [Acinetobacter sp.]